MRRIITGWLGTGLLALTASTALAQGPGIRANGDAGVKVDAGGVHVNADLKANEDRRDRIDDRRDDRKDRQDDRRDLRDDRRDARDDLRDNRDDRRDDRRISKDGADRWRYKYYNGQWWYWVPSNRWMIYTDGHWVDYDRKTYRRPLAYDRGYDRYDGRRYSSGYRGEEFRDRDYRDRDYRDRDNRNDDRGSGIYISPNGRVGVGIDF